MAMIIRMNYINEFKCEWNFELNCGTIQSLNIMMVQIVLDIREWNIEEWNISKNETWQKPQERNISCLDFLTFVGALLQILTILVWPWIFWKLFRDWVRNLEFLKYGNLKLSSQRFRYTDSALGNTFSICWKIYRYFLDI